MKPMTIGQVAKQTGVGIETIRFYERQGLLQTPLRKLSGYRLFSKDILLRLRFIRRAKELGFSLKEVGELLNLQNDPRATRADVKRRAEAKLADIEAKILDLRRMKQSLKKLASLCPGHGPLPGCPILDSLNHDSSILTEDAS